MARRDAPRYAMLEFVAGDAPDVFRRDAQTLIDWLAAAGGHRS
jgi:hypothetical protein